MCEVIHPQTREGYFAYFVYAENTPVENQQNECEGNANKRETFYKLVSRLVRRYIDIANEMEQAGYTAEEAACNDSSKALRPSARRVKRRPLTSSAS